MRAPTWESSVEGAVPRLAAVVASRTQRACRGKPRRAKAQHTRQAGSALLRNKEGRAAFLFARSLKAVHNFVVAQHQRSTSGDP